MSNCEFRNQQTNPFFPNDDGAAVTAVMVGSIMLFGIIHMIIQAVVSVVTAVSLLAFAGIVAFTIISALKIKAGSQQAKMSHKVDDRVETSDKKIENHYHYHQAPDSIKALAPPDMSLGLVKVTEERAPVRYH